MSLEGQVSYDFIAVIYLNLLDTSFVFLNFLVVQISREFLNDGLERSCLSCGNGISYGLLLWMSKKRRI